MVKIMTSHEYRFKLYLKGYKVARNLYAEVGKTILYGPNAAGKTAIMEAIAYILSPTANRIGDKELITINGIHEDFEIKIKLANGEIALEYKHPFFEVRSFLKTEYEHIPSEYEGKSIDDEGMTSYIKRLLGISGAGLKGKIAWIDSSILYISGLKSYDYLKYHQELQLPIISSALEIVERIEEDIYQILPISRIFTDGYDIYVKHEEYGKWISFQNLSYGERKAIAIIFAANLADAIFIEAFEAGLHADLIVDLINYLSKYDKIIIIESHLGLVVAQGVARKWMAYYLEDGRTLKEIKELNQLRDAELYKREIEAMAFSI
ncbi:MAG TPA: ATP-binding protein [Thermoprotei archaeon]|nr:ATP-binding protein [Thermoprotei archaeon]